LFKPFTSDQVSQLKKARNCSWLVCVNHSPLVWLNPTSISFYFIKIIISAVPASAAALQMLAAVFR